MGEVLTDVADEGIRQRKRDLRTAVEDAKAIATVLATEAESVLGRRTARFLGMLGLLAITVFVLLIFLDWYIDPSNPGERKDLVLTLAQILGGAALLSGLYFTWRTLQVNREGQITERFTRAIDQLGATDDHGNKRLEIRLGGIYALERIARDSPKRDYSTVMEVLAAYIRETAPWSPSISESPDGGSVSDLTSDEATEKDGGREQDAEQSTRSVPADIRAILDVIMRREEERVPEERRVRPDFRNADLRGVDLDGAHLEGAFFSGANLERAWLLGTHLEGAWLIETHLEGAQLHGAHLERAWLNNAHLKEAWFAEARLEGAWLTNANLEGAQFAKAHLEGAHLTQATGLTQEQIDWAIGDEETTLPDGVVRPAAWSRSIEEQTEIIEKRLEQTENP